MARRFHNDAVRAARALRRHRTVRWFRLAGHAPFPLAFEMDDEPPVGPGGPHRRRVSGRRAEPGAEPDPAGGRVPSGSGQNDPPPVHWPLLWTGPGSVSHRR